MAKKKAPETDSLSAPPAPPVKRRRVTAPASPHKRRKDPDAPQRPTYDEIAEAAYLRYLNRGGDAGRELDDWLEAERELLDRK